MQTASVGYTIYIYILFSKLKITECPMDAAQRRLPMKVCCANRRNVWLVFYNLKVETECSSALEVFLAYMAESQRERWKDP